MRRLLSCIFIVSVLTAPRLYGDVVHMRSGEEVEGKIKARTQTKIVLEYERGKFRSITLSDIDRIEEKPFAFSPRDGAEKATAQDKETKGEEDKAAARPSPTAQTVKSGVGVGAQTISAGTDFEISLDGGKLKFARVGKTPRPDARVTVVTAARVAGSGTAENALSVVAGKLGRKTGKPKASAGDDVVTIRMMVNVNLPDAGEIAPPLPKPSDAPDGAWVAKNAVSAIFIGPAAAAGKDVRDESKVNAYSNVIVLKDEAAFARE